MILYALEFDIRDVQISVVFLMSFTGEMTTLGNSREITCKEMNRNYSVIPRYLLNELEKARHIETIREYPTVSLTVKL